MSTRRWLMGAAVALLAAAALAAPAQATPIKGTCVFTGDAKVTDKDNTAYGMKLSGGRGSYRFSGTVSCTVMVKGAPAVVILDFVSEGHYHNLLCGTGNVVSQTNTLEWVVADTARKGSEFWAGLLAGLDFSAQFVGTKGIFFINQADSFPLIKANNVGTLFPDDKGTPVADHDIAGTISLEPPLQKPPLLLGPLDNCAKAFFVHAAFKVDL